MVPKQRQNPEGHAEQRPQLRIPHTAPARRRETAGRVQGSARTDFATRQPKLSALRGDLSFSLIRRPQIWLARAKNQGSISNRLSRNALETVDRGNADLQTRFFRASKPRFSKRDFAGCISSTENQDRKNAFSKQDFLRPIFVGQNRGRKNRIVETRFHGDDLRGPISRRQKRLCKNRIFASRFSTSKKTVAKTRSANGIFRPPKNPVSGGVAQGDCPRLGAICG